MSQRIWGSGAAPASESVVSSFTFRLADELVEWDWSSGPPPWRELESVRKPKARALSRHIPASPFCFTTQTRLSVESGLEHDLLRELDRRPDVSWLVAQPCRLAFEDRPGHVPDLLEVSDSGVKIWDVRPRKRQDAVFHKTAARTDQACQQVGLFYGVFDDSSEVRRRNVQWLGCYRSIGECWPLKQVLVSVEAGRASTVGELFDLFDGDLAAVAAMWHLMWRGDLVVDLGTVIGARTALAMRGSDG